MPGHHTFNKFPYPVPSSSFGPGSHSSLRLLNNGVPSSNPNCNNSYQNSSMRRSAQQQLPTHSSNNSPPLITDTLTACLDVNGTYVCTSYSPRCYIIQKVTPTNLHVTTGMAPIGSSNNSSRNQLLPPPPPTQQTTHQSPKTSGEMDGRTQVLQLSSDSGGNGNGPLASCSKGSGAERGNCGGSLSDGRNQGNSSGGCNEKEGSWTLETDSHSATAPNTMRKIVIIRGIPEATPIEEIKALFNKDTNPSAPHCSHCEFAHNDSWYLTFDDEDDATRAHRYIREEIREFKGQPVMARIKSKPTTLLAQGVGVTPTVVSSNGYHQPLPSVTFTINPSAPPFVPIISQSSSTIGPPTSTQLNQLYHQPNHMTTSVSGAVTTIPPIFAAIATAPQPNPYTAYTPNATWVNDPNNYNLNGHGGHHGPPHRQHYNSSSGRGGGGMGMDLNGRPRTSRPTNRHMSTTNNYNRRYNPNPPPRPLENHQNNPPSSSNHHRYYPSNNNNNNHRPRNNVKSTPPTSTLQQTNTNTTNSLPRNSKFDLVTSESAFPPLVGVNVGSSDSATTTTDVVSNHKGDGYAAATVEGRLSADVVKGIKASNVPKSSNTTSLPMQTNNTAPTPGILNDENNQSASAYVVSAASPPPPSSQALNEHPCPNHHQSSTSHASVTKKQFREVGVGSVDDYDYYEESCNAREEKKTKTRSSSSSSSSTCAYKNPASSKNTADKSTQMNPVVRSGKNTSSSSSGGVGGTSGSNHIKNSAITSNNNKTQPETKTVVPTAITSNHNKVNRSGSTSGNSTQAKVMKDTSTSTVTTSSPTPDIPENCSKSASGLDASMSKIKLSYADVARANKSQQ